VRSRATSRISSDAIARIESYAAVGQERFFAEPLRQDAIIRQLEIIGEATKQLSMELRNRHPEVTWRSMAALRDVLIHNYMGVDLDVVWGVTQQALPELKLNIEAILSHDIPD
jgi:uncharacterized protein with HEPN domain